MFQISTSSKTLYASAKQLGSDSSFLLKLRGYNVLVLRLPAEVVREISGQDLVAMGSVLSRLKARLKFSAEADRWLAITSVDNPLLQELDTLQASVAQELSYTIGTSILESNVEVCATVPLNETEPFDPTAE